jgi:hypothetical protein
MVIRMLNEQTNVSEVVEALLSCGYEKNYKGEYAKYYDSGGFIVFVNPRTGDCYYEDNATFNEINADLKPIDSPDKVEELDRLASISWTKIAEPIDQYKSRMSKNADLINGVWVKKNPGYLIKEGYYDSDEEYAVSGHWLASATYADGTEVEKEFPYTAENYREEQEEQYRLESWLLDYHPDCTWYSVSFVEDW